MPQKQYTLDEKFRTLWLLRDMSLEKASQVSGVSAPTIRKWKEQEAKIRYDYYLRLHDDVSQMLLFAQRDMAKMLGKLVAAVDEKRIKSAPLNQLISGMGLLIDRIIKVNDVKEIENHDSPIRFEYYNAATGATSDAPPWAETDNEQGESFYSRIMREALRQDGTSESFNYGTGLSWDEDVVARPDLLDGESGLEGFESRPDRYDWYQD